MLTGSDTAIDALSAGPRPPPCPAGRFLTRPKCPDLPEPRPTRGDTWVLDLSRHSEPAAKRSTKHGRDQLIAYSRIRV
jgi:hypothetical protein